MVVVRQTVAPKTEKDLFPKVSKEKHLKEARQLSRICFVRKALRINLLKMLTHSHNEIEIAGPACCLTH